jgi:hypothetical protein
LDEPPATPAHDAQHSTAGQPDGAAGDRIDGGDAAAGRTRGATLIRHPGRSPAPVLTLAIDVVEASFGGLLMAAVGCTPLLLTADLAARLAAVPLAAIARTADEEQRPAGSRVASPLIEKSLLNARHPDPEAGLDRRRGS